ncbi:MAG: hypothetical protein EBV83_06005 [Verrucomicrobia bacterium]|nr:hypothetical protein [Verrucomicrobiota bacterium]
MIGSIFQLHVTSCPKNFTPYDERMLRWLALVLLGLLLNGAGLSLLAWAAHQKFSAGGEWFWSGTLAIALCNAGICCLVGSQKSESRT